MTRKITMSEDTRLDHLEHSVAEFGTRLASVETNIAYIKTYVERSDNNSRTNWGTMAAWAGVILSVVLYHANLTVSPLKEAFASHQQYHLKAEDKALADNIRWQDIEKVYIEKISQAESRLASIEQNISSGNKNHNTLSQELVNIRYDIDAIHKTRFSKEDSIILIDKIGNNSKELGILMGKIDLLERQIKVN